MLTWIRLTLSRFQRSKSCRTLKFAREKDPLLAAFITESKSACNWLSMLLHSLKRLKTLTCRISSRQSTLVRQWKIHTSKRKSKKPPIQMMPPLFPRLSLMPQYNRKSKRRRRSISIKLNSLWHQNSYKSLKSPKDPNFWLSKDLQELVKLVFALKYFVLGIKWANKRS